MLTSNLFSETRFRFSYFLLIVFLLELSGCYKTVGGSCIYEKQIGTVKIVSNAPEGPIGVFTPASQSSYRNGQWWGHKLSLPKDTQVDEGREYPASLSAIEEGSCIPATLVALSDKRRSLALPLSLTREGKEPEENRDTNCPYCRCDQAATATMPQMKLLITQTETNLSENEDNEAVAEHFTQGLRLYLKKPVCHPSLLNSPMTTTISLLLATLMKSFRVSWFPSSLRDKPIC